MNHLENCEISLGTLALVVASFEKTVVVVQRAERSPADLAREAATALELGVVAGMIALVVMTGLKVVQAKLKRAKDQEAAQAILGILKTVRGKGRATPAEKKELVGLVKKLSAAERKALKQAVDAETPDI